MNIIYYSMANDTPMYTWQQYNFIDELSRHGISVTVFNPLLYENFDDANNELIKQLKKHSYDLFMTSHNEKILYMDTIEKLHSIGIPMLLICFDNLLIPFEHQKVAKEFDVVWLTSKENKNMFDKWGAKTIFLPYAANPYFYRTSNVEEINRVVFLGTPYGSRANTINFLLDNDIPVSLFGKTTEASNFHSYTKGFIKTVYDDIRFPIGRKLLEAAAKQKLMNDTRIITESTNLIVEGFAEEIDAIYSKYALSLSSTSARNTGILRHPVPVVNLRSFEIPMSGGIQFCQFNEELSGYFENKKEIIYYESNEEMVEKAKFYLSEDNKNIRIKIRENARKRAENEHTWYCRFKRVFSNLGI